MQLSLKANQHYTFHNLNGTKKYTVKKSKCRHYFVSTYDTVLKRHSKFKRVKLSTIQQIIDLLIKTRKQRKARLLVAKQEKKSVLNATSKVLKSFVSSLQVSTEKLNSGLLRGFV